METMGPVRLVYTLFIAMVSALVSMVLVMLFDNIFNLDIISTIVLAILAIGVYLVILYLILQSFEIYIKERY